MLNYTLAKELKEAGFSQKMMGVHDIQDEPISYVPTLSELIEACGEGFESLRRGKGFERRGEDFVAVSDGWIANSPEIDNGTYHIGGSTPEEAAARLWLVLNKK